ncbi:hypothetical protein [Exiguobacterium sp. s142]|uniref:hypothetical protein n=1 Tax=Exiguobacterium sp. s142 TaxID=2751222 RepID=UPI001BE7899D|nr:hypothetical protein [Exiguobacterium sp. s142]
MRELDDSLITSIDPYIEKRYIPPTPLQQACLFDTMILTRLAKVARDYPADFNHFIDELISLNAILYIPEIILEETAGNRGMTMELYRDLHQPMFRKLSEKIPVQVLSFEMIYDILAATMNHTDHAFLKFRLLNVHLNETNKTIQHAIEVAASPEEIFHALSQQKKDLGERILHLLAFVLLEDGVPDVRLFSDEEKGVYNVRRLLSADEKVLALLHIQNQPSFLKAYQLESFDCLLCSILSKRRDVWSEEDMITFLSKHRAGKHLHRKLRFSYSVRDVDYRQLDNQELVQLVCRNEEFRTTF